MKKSESQVFAGLELPPLDREGVRLYRSGTENFVPGARSCRRSRGGKVPLASHAKSNATRPGRAQASDAVPVEVSACSFDL